MYEHHLCDVSDKHLARRSTFTRDRSIGTHSASDLRLTWPRPLVALDRIDIIARENSSVVKLAIALAGLERRFPGC